MNQLVSLLTIALTMKGTCRKVETHLKMGRQAIFSASSSSFVVHTFCVLIVSVILDTYDIKESSIILAQDY